ncbi:MAG TPA: glycosyltransferase family 39 protein [Thermodesulfovibrionales bacterium]|nr:glycosyltransferase family 39 protein [Thermodesulfovibrionales bacterium]
MLDWLAQRDTALFFLINRGLENTFFDLLMPFVTDRSYLIILLFVIYLLLKEKKKALVMCLIGFLAILLSDVTGSAVKHLVQRPRPCSFLEGAHLLAGCGKSFSMPSNHATNSFAFAFPFVVMSSSRVRYIFVFIASLVCLSRVYVGVHYPLDVIAGACLGSVVALSVVSLYRWAEKRFNDHPHTTVLFVFFLALTIFRIYYIIDGPLDLSPDEAHYWEWSRRLDLSYYSKGPVIAYLMAFGTSLFGANVFGARVLAILFSTLTSLLLYKLGRELSDETTGAASALLFQALPLFAPFGVIFTIDSPFVFFWTLSLYFFWRAVNGNALCVMRYEVEDSCHRSRITDHGSRFYWILLGISTGLGLLTKYTMAFFVACAFLFLVFSKEKRAILRSAPPYISLLISLLLFSPVVIWNAQHDWVTLRHTAGQAHVAEGLQISPGSFFEFVGSQFGVITPVILVLMIAAVVKDRPFSRPLRASFLFWFSAPVVLFFLLKSLQGKVQANWAMTAYLTGIIAFSGVFLSSWKELRRSLKTAVLAGLALCLLVTAVAYYPAAFHVPVKLDPSARLRGWKELGKEVSAIQADISGQGNLFIFSDSYQVSSELAFYVKDHPVTYCANLGRRMNQYDLWPGFETLVHYNGIFVTIGDTELDPKIRDAFQGYEKRLLKVYEKGRPLREYSIFVCRDFKGMTREATGSY